MTLITNTDSSILPYNDDEMVYDIDRQMYVLTNKGIDRLTGYNFLDLSGDDTKATRNRYRISQDVYNFIRRYAKRYNFKQRVYEIAKDANIREDFKLLLAEQTVYYIESGAGSLKNMHGVDISKGKAMDLASIRGEVLVSATVRDILSSLGLLFTGYTYHYNIEEDGTW